MENYKYYAFVSYRSSDEKWAKWLQDKIEAYRLPTTVQKMNAALPKSKLRPCFRYHTDIQPNELKTELRNKLEQSKYLLVLCTPRSAQSPWVGNEIDTFVELGRRDRIIPVIVEGRPYSGDPATECYNPSLIKHFPHSDNIAEDHEILGVNIHEEGRGSAWMKRERAIIQIVSRMLDVNYDQLWNRQRRRLISRAVLTVILSLLFLGAIAMTWIVNQPFNAQVALSEQTVHNNNLPAMHDAVVTLTVANETKPGGAGNYINIKHENGLITQYLHLNSILVSKGERVSACQQIATSGNTGQSISGQSYAAHLDYRIRFDSDRNKYVDILCPCKTSNRNTQDSYNTNLDVSCAHSLFNAPYKFKNVATKHSKWRVEHGHCMQNMGSVLPDEISQ